VTTRALLGRLTLRKHLLWQKEKEGIGERSKEAKEQKVERMEKDVAFSKGTYRG